MRTFNLWSNPSYPQAKMPVILCAIRDLSPENGQVVHILEDVHTYCSTGLSTGLVAKICSVAGPLRSTMGGDLG